MRRLAPFLLALILGCLSLSGATTPVARTVAQVRVPLLTHLGAVHPFISTRDICLTCDKWDSAPRPHAGALIGPLSVRDLITPTGYTPQDLWSAYNLPSASITRTGTVAIVDAYQDPTAASDLAIYRAQFGLPPCTVSSGCLRIVGADPSSDPATITSTLPAINTDWALEMSLDLDMVSATCPFCKIILVEANDASSQSLFTAVRGAATLHPDAISLSWGIPEFDVPKTCPAITNPFQASDCYDQATMIAFFNQYFVFPGIATVVSSGDSGYGVNLPASVPGVVSVGGTHLSRDSSVPRGWNETVWGVSAYGSWEGGGSGCSAWMPKMPWQGDRFCANRTVADLSFVADPNTGVAVYDSSPLWGTHSKSWVYGWFPVGGTSAGAPAIAGLFALAHDRAALRAPGAHLYSHPWSFNDVIQGTNAYPCACWKGPLYLRTAMPGYDGPSGLGSVNGIGAF